MRACFQRAGDAGRFPAGRVLEAGMRRDAHGSAIASAWARPAGRAPRQLLPWLRFRALICCVT
jgi:hypothetical protein